MFRTFMIYILVFEDKNYIKIGITGVGKNRIMQIEPLWGRVDSRESCHSIVMGTVALEVENALKIILSRYRVCESGEAGYTEIFSVKALSMAIHMLETYSQAPVIKGINPNLSLNA